MFPKLLKHLASSSAVASIPPESFDDPLAIETEWLPLKGGGTNFQSSHLHQLTSTRWEFRSSAVLKIVSGIFAIIGIAAIAFTLLKFPGWSREIPLHKDFLFPTGFGLLFVIAAFLIGFSAAVPAVFDKDRGYFSKSLKRPERLANPSKLKNYTELQRIHAIQLLAEKCRGEKSTYYSYELNLVLNDASRLNVTDHGDLQAIREDAHRLAEFLGKPIWDSI